MKCMLTSLAHVLEIDPEEVFKRTKGIEEQVVDPMAIGANRYRGIHAQELIDLCLSWGFAAIEVDANPILTFRMADGTDKDLAIYPNPQVRFDHYISNYDGILLGVMEGSYTGHAVAWKNKEVYDATGAYKDGRVFNVESFVIIKRFN